MGRKLKKSRTHPTTQEDKLIEEDRLTSLPDAILVDILSLLPLKSAVSTAVLSRRWRHLWTQTTSVDIDCRHFNDFYTTVDQLLSKLTSPIVRNFTLCIPLKPEPEPKPETSSPPRSLVIGSWLQRICARKVESIKVVVEGRRDAGVVIGTLPSCIFDTRTLVVLQLINIDCKLPDELEMHNSNINLPNLVTLCLSIYCSQCGLVAILIKFCPLLEHLRLDGVGDWELSDGEDSFVVDIRNANVKRLHLKVPFTPKSTKIVVDTPELTSLVVIGNFLNCSFLKKPVHLNEAEICISCQALRGCLLPVLCNVAVLRAHPLIFYDLNDGGLGDEITPWTFPNLRDLYLYCGNGDTDIYWSIFPLDSVTARRVLHCVKRISLETMNVKNGEYLLNMIKILLINAPVLETLDIHVTDRSRINSQLETLHDETLFVRELYGYPRVLSLRQIEFLGQYIKLPGRPRAMVDLEGEIERTTRLVEVFDSLTSSGQ